LPVLSLKFPKKKLKSPKIAVVGNPSHLTPRQEESPRYPHTPYISRNQSHWPTFLSLTVCVYLDSNLCSGLQRRIFAETECVLAVQGHPRLMILVPIESAYGTSY